jgi:hydrogenase expression/formation protein HypE
MGKLESEELKKLLNCIKTDPRVIVPPQIGYDAGVHRIGNKYVAVAADPCIGVPPEWFGWLLIHYAASDLSLFGATPEFCTVTLMGPRTISLQKFQEIMQQTCSAANELGMAIVRGHTGTYEDLTALVGVCTAYGTVEPEKLKTPKNAKAGDLILCTKPIGLETAVNFTIMHKVLAQKLFGKKRAQNLSKLIQMQSCVREALQLAKIKGVHAMHDATEGGLVACLNELAEASELGFELDFEKVPLITEATSLQECFGLSYEQTLAMSSTGTIVAAVDSQARTEVEKTLNALKLKASFIGEFKENRSRIMNKEGKKETFPLIPNDPYTKIFSATSQT